MDIENFRKKADFELIDQRSRPGSEKALVGNECDEHADQKLSIHYKARADPQHNDTFQSE